VVFSTPDNTEWKMYAQPTAETKYFAFEEIKRPVGFLIAPFLKNDKATLIHADYQPSEKKYNDSPQESPIESSKPIYFNQFKKYQDALKSGRLKKAILSRVISTEIVESELDEVLFKLKKEYPKTLVYLFRTQNFGTWIGATPEQLVRYQNQQLSLHSLAGTLPSASTENWQQKEKDEQQFVTDFIAEILTQNRVNYQKNEAKTVFAGPVKHLRTDFSANQKIHPPQLLKIIENLHPTPAVCGIPTERAYQLIASTEMHKRLCYTGFLGEFDFDNCNLFVNLRCAQIADNKAFLFVGGGITKDSDAEKEWEETNHKAQTLLNVFDNIAKR